MQCISQRENPLYGSRNRYRLLIGKLDVCLLAACALQTQDFKSQLQDVAQP